MKIFRLGYPVTSKWALTGDEEVKLVFPGKDRSVNPVGEKYRDLPDVMVSGTRNCVNTNLHVLI